MYSSQPGQQQYPTTEVQGYPAVPVLLPCCVVGVFERRLLVEKFAGGCSGGATSCSFSLLQAIRGAAKRHRARNQTGAASQPAAARHLWGGGGLQAARTPAAADAIAAAAVLLVGPAAVVAVSAPAAAPVVVVRPAAAAQAPRLACRGPRHLHQAGRSADVCWCCCAATLVCCSCVILRRHCHSVGCSCVPCGCDSKSWRTYGTLHVEFTLSLEVAARGIMPI